MSWKKLAFQVGLVAVKHYSKKRKKKKKVKKK